MSPADLHRARRVDLAVMRWRAKRARERGQRATVIGHTGYGSQRWVRVLGRVLLAKEPRDRRTAEPTGSRGWRSFTSVPVESAEVEVTIDGRTHLVQADNGGIVDVVIESRLSPGRHTIMMSSEGSEPTPAAVFVVGDDRRIGVVSDIDDTVMVTALPRPLLAAWHTFVVNEHARSTTPGMPVLYERLRAAHDSPPWFYLSTGAWNVAPTLTRFLSRNLYPPGALLLTDWGPTADSWFRSGQEHKRSNLNRLASEFPEIRWILVGDDGQHDEEIYGAFAAAHPHQVAAVCIRQLTPSEAVLAGSALRESSAASRVDVPWVYGYDGAGLAKKLEELELLHAPERQPEVPA